MNLLEEPVITYFYDGAIHNPEMSENPEERNKDSRKASESNINQQDEPPLGKTDPTEPVKVSGSKQGKVTSI